MFVNSVSIRQFYDCFLQFLTSFSLCIAVNYYHGGFSDCTLSQQLNDDTFGLKIADFISSIELLSYDARFQGLEL